MRILYADDRADEIIREDLSGQLKDNGIEPQIMVKKTIADAITAIISEEYDLALIDLRFENDTKDGNEIIRTILERDSLPIVVFSGFIGTLDDEFSSHPAVRISESKTTDSVVNIILNLKENGILEFFSQKIGVAKDIQKISNEIFWNGIPFEDVKSVPSKEIGNMLRRMIASQLYNEFLEASTGDDCKIFHNEIFVKPKTENISVGDIVRFESGYEIVLTPNCDLVRSRRKVKQILTASLIIVEKFEELFKDSTPTLKNSPKKIGALMKYMRHSDDTDGKNFYLPPTKNFPGGAFSFLNLNLHEITNDKYDDFKEKIILSLNTQMSSELSTRYARYTSRLGQSEYNEELLVCECCRKMMSN